METVALWSNIWIGVITGVLTAVFIGLVKWFWDSTFYPFLERVRYNGIVISGPWYGIDNNESGEVSNEVSLLLSQSAHRVTGTFLLQHSSPEKNFELNYNVVGTIWEGYVTLSMSPIDRTVTSSAAGLVKIAGGGISLVGILVGRNVNSEAVVHIDLYLARGPRHIVRPQLLKADAERWAARRDSEAEECETQAPTLDGRSDEQHS